ncbi:MAG TPA: DUF998 domain-containing protein [Candidatus Dormibacteraeota bacterium]|nr:DUF998 domain-containing protein [Candidatus Dormibacteraeota bacterium]
MKRLNIILAITVAAGAVLWNGWVFGFFNHGLAGYIHMSISELEAVGQPHEYFFDALENVSGIAMIVGALGLLIVALRRKFNAVLILILGAIVFIGGLTLYDVAHPLDCNRYNNPACVATVNANELSHGDILHNDESRVTAYATIVLSILIVFWAPLKTLQRFELIGLIIIVAGVVTTLALLNFDDNLVLSAVSERVWNVLVSLDVGYVAWKLIKPKGLSRPAV